MTDPTLEAIKARLAAAPQVPQRLDSEFLRLVIVANCLQGEGRERNKAASEFLAAAPEDIQYLITRLEASEAEVERLRDLVMESAPVSWAGQGWDGGGVDAAQAWEKRVVELLGKEPTGTTAAPKEHEAMG